MFIELIHLFRDVDYNNDCNQYHHYEEERREYLFNNITIEEFHNLVATIFTIRFFHSTKVPSSIFCLASLTSQR